MATEASAFSRMKEFKFRVEINGLHVARVQEFDPGTRTHGVTEHAGAGQNHSDKEAGAITFDNATMKTVVPIEGDGKKYWEVWMNQAQDAETGNGMLPKQYMRNFTMFELAPNGEPVRIWEYYKAFPVKYTLGNRSAMTKDADVIEEIEIAYTSRKQRL